MSELADSRKLGKQSVLPEKVIRLLTNLRLSDPPHPRASQARLKKKGSRPWALGLQNGPWRRGCGDVEQRQAENPGLDTTALQQVKSFNHS